MPLAASTSLGHFEMICANHASRPHKQPARGGQDIVGLGSKLGGARDAVGTLSACAAWKAAAGLAWFGRSMDRHHVEAR